MPSPCKLRLQNTNCRGTQTFSPWQAQTKNVREEHKEPPIQKLSPSCKNCSSWKQLSENNCRGKPSREATAFNDFQLADPSSSLSLARDNPCFLNFNNGFEHHLEAKEWVAQGCTLRLSLEEGSQGTTKILWDGTRHCHHHILTTTYMGPTYVCAVTMHDCLSIPQKCELTLTEGLQGA